MPDNNNSARQNCSPPNAEQANAGEMLAQQLAKMFAALAHPARSRIIIELGRGELCVNDLSDMLKISHSSVSQHLAILRSQGLIKEQKAGRFVFYRLINPNLANWLGDGGHFAEVHNDGAFNHSLGESQNMAPQAVQSVNTENQLAERQPQERPLSDSMSQAGR